MSTKTLPGKSTLVFTILAVLCAAIPVQAADSTDVLLNMLPDNCVFCLRINNFNESLGKLDQYMAGASPIPVSLAMLVNLQLGAIVGDPMLKGIEMNGNFMIVGLSDMTFGLLVPVTNYAEFVKTSPNCKPAEGGITMLDSQEVDLVMTEFAGGKYVLAVPEPQQESLPALKIALTNTSATLAGKLSAAQAKEAALAPVWTYINLAGLYEKYNQDALGMLEMAQKGIGQTAGPAEMMAFQFKMLTEMFKQFGGEADSMTVALAPESTILNLDLGLRAKDGSDLAKMMVADKNTDGYKLTGYLDNKNAVNGLMKMNRPFMQASYDKMFDIMEATTDNPTSKEQTAKMKALTQKMLAAMGDEISFSFSYAGMRPPFKLQEVIEIKDPSAMKTLMTEGIDYANTLYKEMGIPAELKYQPGTIPYKNTTIDTVLLSISASDDSNDMMQKELEKMYGDSFKYYLAQSSDKLYITMGQGGEETLKALIDQPATAAAPSGDIKVALDALQNTPYNDFVCSVNVIKLMQGMGEMMQAMDAQSGTNPAGAMFSGLKNVPSQSCFVMGGNISDGQAAMRLAVPKQHLVEIVAAAMQVQMQMAAAQQQPQNQDFTPQVFEPVPSQETPKEPLMEWIGKPAPELKMVDLDGTIHRVSRFKGKKVMLDFWATWCPPCKESIPDLIKLRADSSDSELVIIGLSNEPTGTISPFAKKAKINYPITSYHIEDVPAPYNQVAFLPTLIMIDSNGVIRDVLTGYHELPEIQARLSKLK